MLWQCIAAVATGWAVLATVGWVCAALDREAARASSRKYEELWLTELETKPQQTAERAG